MLKNHVRICAAVLNAARLQDKVVVWKKRGKTQASLHVCNALRQRAPWPLCSTGMLSPEPAVENSTMKFSSTVVISIVGFKHQETIRFL
jgi:hypothetical protein